MIREPIITAVEGADYLYTADVPKGCKGHLYRIVHFVQDVPSYQEKLCMEALTGPDRGLRFIVSPWNFALRYEPAEHPVTVAPRAPDPPLPEKVAGFVQQGSGV
jgi:hypothetical protein